MTVKEKEKQLLKLPDRELIDRILAFPDREHLNRDEDGKRRKYPSAEMAVNARRNMEKDPEWKISDKQRWAMSHSFAAYSSNELKVAGIKFANADPNELLKVPVEKDGVKAVYNIIYHLTPEPENEHDKNAVAVYVDNKTEERVKIGYVPAAYTGIHPISQPMTVKGTLTDHSNGHFKTISYVMDMDTEAIDKEFLSNNSPDVYTYRMPFLLNGDVKEDAADYLNSQRDWTLALNNELEYWGVNGCADQVSFDFPASKAGNIIVETAMQLNPEAMQVCGSYFRYALESGISSDLKQNKYVDVPLNQPAVNTRDKTYFSLQSEPDFAEALNNISEDNGQKL